MTKTDTPNSHIPNSPSKDDYTKDPAYIAQVKGNAAPIFDKNDPLSLFDAWLAEAKKSEPNGANAMSLATVDKGGLPDVRMVLLKGMDARGFVFYSHAKSAKGIQLSDCPKAAINFHWKSLRRQVRIRGTVEQVTKAEVGAYFATRARDSRIGAWASKQSSSMDSEAEFETMLDKITKKFKGVSVPLPPGWCGWRVQPLQIEFWRDKPFRLHDRLLFSRKSVDEAWAKNRLYP